MDSLLISLRTDNALMNTAVLLESVAFFRIRPYRSSLQRPSFRLYDRICISLSSTSRYKPYGRGGLHRSQQKGRTACQMAVYGLLVLSVNTVPVLLAGFEHSVKISLIISNKITLP